MSQIVRDITEIARYGALYRGGKLAPVELKARHSSYLTEICACPGISQDQLATRICMNKSSVARQVAVLEEAGFLLRSPSETDKRMMQLYPTEKTLSLLPQILLTLRVWEQHITAGLTDDEVQTLASLLAKVKVKAADWMGAE